MKAFGKLKWLLMLTMLYGGVVNAHVYWDFNAPDNSGDGTINHPVRDFSAAVNLLSAQPEDQWIIILSTITTDFNWGMNGTMSGNRIAQVKRAENLKDPLFRIKSGTFTIQNVTISGGFEGDGPFTDKENYESLILLDTCTTLIIKSGAVLRDNYMGTSSSRLGGAVQGLDATVIMNGGLITNCRTMLRGGGIYLASSLKPCTFTMNDGEVSYCKTKDYGGGIFVSGKTTIQSSVVLNKGDIHNCTAYDDVFRADNGRGGGVCFFYSEVHIQGDEVLIHDNLAKRYGGGVRMNYSDVTFSAGKVYNNVASEGIDGLVPGSGGMALVTCLFSMSGGEIYNNVSGVGGGIGIAHEGVLEITGGKIYNNVGFCQGGGINLNTGTSLTMPVGSTLEMYGNKSSRGGAILADAGTLTIYDGVYHDNIAADTLTLYDDTEDKVLNNLGKGGAFCIVMENDGTGFVPANFYVYGGSIYNNTASVSGGALYMLKNITFSALENPKIVIKGGEIYNNSATTGNGGGMYADDGTVFTMTADTIMEGSVISEIHTGNIHDNTAGQSGGGIYITDALFTMSAGKFENNSAGQMGGGFCITGDNSEITIEGGEIKNNTASGKGGGFAVIGGDVEISEANSGYPTSVSSNTAPQGGGLYVCDGSVTVSDSDIIGNTTTAGNGGAFLIDNGDLTVSNCSITGNHAPNGNGGGAYVGNGDIEFNAGTTVTNNTAINGGGLCIDGGIITYNAGTVTGNTATVNGGGLYVNAASLTDTTFFRGGTVSNNTAVNGGGVYVNGGTLDFSSGTFSQNSATGNGGGIYVKPGALALLSGTATLTKNHVPETSGDAVGRGGGIYLGGQMKVGRKATDPQGTHSLQVQDNYAGTESQLNNIFLPTNNNVIELLSDMREASGGKTTGTKVGFSVNNGFRKVVYHQNDAGSAANSWLHGLLTEGGTQGLTGVIFDDSRKYMAVHVLASDPTFDHNYIYLWGCWISAVYQDPQAHLDEYPLPTGVAQHYTLDSDSTWHIYTKEGLAWLSSSVNGLNGCKYRPDTKAVMEADVDMSDFLWVPLGSAASFDPANNDPASSIFQDGHQFSGSFDGKGHVIKGLDCRYINSLHNYGLFGEVIGDADIRNTFVDNYLYNSSLETDAYIMGGIAGCASDNAVICNCESRGHMASPNSSASSLGGIVGILHNGAMVHSCIGLPEVDGKAGNMGGLAGQVEAGASVVNSFSNPKIGGTVTDDEVGGIAGTNAGTIANCYVRLQHSDAPANFYWLAAVNDGTIKYCYYRGDALSDNITTGTDPTDCDAYGATVLVNGKYGFGQDDQKVGDDHLLDTLNGWVAIQPAAKGYATWTRTMASSINGDYPIHAFADFSNAASRDGVYLEYSGDVNTMVDKYNAYSGGGVVYLYGTNPAPLSVSTNNNVRMHIGEDIGVVAGESVVTNARVGVTFDNSSGNDLGGKPYDWHMFSPALANAPVGLEYHSQESGYSGVSDYDVRINYDTYVGGGIPSNVYHDRTKMDPPRTTWNTTAGSIGYFPTDTPYGTWRNTTPQQAYDDGIENHVGSFDFYKYSEPDVHWINFKREGTATFCDHWRDDDLWNPGYHAHIDIVNETTLVRGRGYLMAVSDPTLLMADGTLNNGTFTTDVTAEATGYYDGRLNGVNLIGNPYQSYLDFDDFADLNGLTTYYVLDADKKGYIARVKGGSTPSPANPMVVDYTAPRYIHPHQGFFVKVGATGTVQFTNDMRKTTGGDFRGDDEPHYPMVTLACTDNGGCNDFATVEMNRPEAGGGEKLIGLRSGTASIWFHCDGTNWQTAFTTAGTTEAPLRFKAYEDGVYTLTWQAANADFHYLHLVDNLTGVDVDCLASDKYVFEASTEDYISRFKLVFDYTGVEENEGDGSSTGSETFAFQTGDELMVNGEGTLQLFDASGRCLLTTETRGTQTALRLPKVAAGVYVLRLTEAKGVRVQKMVIK